MNAPQAKVLASAPTAGAPLLVKVSDIQPLKDQPRNASNPGFSERSLQRLAASIKQIGLKKPIILRPLHKDKSHRYEIIDGERRWRAHIIAKIEYLPAIIQEIKNEDEQNLASLVLNHLGEPHTHMEISNTFARQVRSGRSVAELAVIMGWAESYVYQYLSLQKLLPELQELMHPSVPDDKRLRFDVAITIAGASKESQEGIYRQVMEHRGARQRVQCAREMTHVSGLSKRSPTHYIRSFRSFVNRVSDGTHAVLTMPNEIFTLIVSTTPPGELRRMLQEIDKVVAGLETIRINIRSIEKKQA